MVNKTDEIIAALRNAYDQTPEQMRDIRLRAADEIEKWQDAYLNMKTFAEDNGLDTTARHEPAS